jgi:hypothetical protein
MFHMSEALCLRAFLYFMRVDMEIVPSFNSDKPALQTGEIAAGDLTTESDTSNAVMIQFNFYSLL